MATKKATSVLTFDLAEFKRQKALVDQHATKEIAERIEVVKGLLREIKDLAELSGNVTIRLGGSYGELSDLIEDVDSKHKDWNSSSYDC